MSKRGKFIVFEGIDGAGKTTMAKRATEYLNKEWGMKTLYTREASDGPVGKLLREEFLTGKRKCDERIIQILYAADRLDHLTNEEDGILKKLDEGYNIITDRFWMSSVAYGLYPEVDLDKPSYTSNWETYTASKLTHSFNAYAKQLIRPNVWIYIDCPPEIAYDRIKSRSENESIYEEKEKLKKIYKAYEYATESMGKDVNLYPETMVTVDGTLPEDLMFDEVKKILRTDEYFEDKGER